MKYNKVTLGEITIDLINFVNHKIKLLNLRSEDSDKLYREHLCYPLQSLTRSHIEILRHRLRHPLKQASQNSINVLFEIIIRVHEYLF